MSAALGVETHQILYFLKVAQTLSFTKAAQALHVTQPSISRQIKLLEEELGVSLFERLPGGLRLTPAGDVVQAQFTEVVKRLEETRHLVAPFADASRRAIRIACLPSLASTLLPAPLAAFVRAHPAARTAMKVIDDGEDPGQAVRRGEADLAIGELYCPDLHQLPLADEPLLVALPADHPCAGLAAVEPEHLVDAPLILPGVCSVRRRVEEAWPSTLPSVLDVPQLDTALRLAAQGLGVTVVPALMAHQAAVPGVQLRPLQPPLARTIYLSWRQGPVSRAHPLVRLLAQGAQRSAVLLPLGSGSLG